MSVKVASRFELHARRSRCRFGDPLLNPTAIWPLNCFQEYPLRHEMALGSRRFFPPLPPLSPSFCLSFYSKPPRHLELARRPPPSVQQDFVVEEKRQIGEG